MTVLPDNSVDGSQDPTQSKKTTSCEVAPTTPTWVGIPKSVKLCPLKLD